MLSATYRPFKLSVVMLNVIMLSVIMLSVVMLSVLQSIVLWLSENVKRNFAEMFVM